MVGLGVGTMAALGRPGDTFRFYEINPEVETIARTWFTYLKDSKARTEVVLGDARVQLERELAQGQSQDFDAIAVDAFSSDAIPIHLLTAECADMYRRRLAPGGLLLLHISNRRLNLEPVTRGLAQHLGWGAVQYISPADERTGERRAQWVLTPANREFLQRPDVSEHDFGVGPGERAGRSSGRTISPACGTCWTGEPGRIGLLWRVHRQAPPSTVRSQPPQAQLTSKPRAAGSAATRASAAVASASAGVGGGTAIALADAPELRL